MNMKKFRLKPLGDLRQKLSMNWFFIGLIMALCVSACSDDDDNNTTPAFPEKQTINCGVGDTKELTFDANADWTLTSSATWCRFVVNGNDEYSLSGNAGKQTITLKITDEAQQSEAKSIAQITLMMGSSKAIIADVARNAKGFELKLYDMDGNEISEIEVGYNKYKSFKVKANFRFAATNRPEWVDIEGGVIVGITNKEVVGGVQVADDAKFFKYIQNGVITFADEKGLASYTFPLVYKGMDSKDIKVTRPTTNVWGWTVSLDGKTFSQSGSTTTSTSSATSYKYRIPYTVSAFDDDIQAVYLEKVIEYGVARFAIDGDGDDVVDWMQLEGTKGNMTLSVKASDKEREGYVLVFSRAKFNEIKDDLWGNLIEMADGEQLIKWEYEQANLLIQLTQKEAKPEEEQQLIKVMTEDTGMGSQEIKCTKVSDDEAEFYMSEYHALGVYSIKAESATSIRIYANSFSIANYQVVYNSGSFENCELSNDDTGVPFLGVWGFNRLKGDLGIVVQDADHIKAAVLIIKP